jgi:hypothetical protein
VANNPYAIRHLQEFYNEAPVGSPLYVMLVATTLTVKDMADKTNSAGAIKLLNYAQGAIKVIAVLADDKAINTASGTITITNGMNADVYTAAANMKALINVFVAAENPLRGIIGGTSYAGTAASLTAINGGTTNNRVAIVMGDTQSYDATYTSAAVGLCLGRIAAIPVQRKISRVKDGALSNAAAYLNTVALTLADGDMATIAGKGYITFTMYPNLSGFFWSGDPTATATTDDYAMLARGRIIDKAHRLAYARLVQEVDDEVPAIPGTGVIEPGFAANLSNAVEATINQNMTVFNNCTGSKCFVDPTQNVVSSNVVNAALTIYGVGYSTTINLKLGFGL